jgi:hypothetical protein
VLVKGTVGARCDADAVSENTMDQPENRVNDGVATILAALLHVGDAVRQDGVLRRVTSLRIQGVPPEVCVEFDGIPGRRHFLTTDQVEGVRPTRRRSSEVSNYFG